MRYFIVAVQKPPLGPWVVAETCDEEQARDGIDPRGEVSVSEAEVEARTDPLVTPEVVEAVRAWKVGNDSTHDRVLELEKARRNAEEEAWRLEEILR